MAKEIKIAGKMRSATTEGILADAAEIQQETGLTVEQAIKELDNKATTADSDISKLNANTGIDEYEEFSDQKEYKAGTTVMKDGLLYTFITDHAVGAWNPDEVENGSLKADLERNIFFENCPFIKEAYINNEEITKFLWIRKNYSGTNEHEYGVNLCNEEETVSASFKAISEGYEGVIKLNDGKSYLVIDWNHPSIKENYNNLIRGKIKSCARNIDYSPSIKEFINRIVVESTINDSDNPVSSKAVSEYKKEQANVIDKIKYPTDFVEETPYIKELYIDTEDVKILWLLRRNVSGNGKYQIAFSDNVSGDNSVLWEGSVDNYYDNDIIHIKRGNNNIYCMVNFSEIPDKTIVNTLKNIQKCAYDLKYSPLIASYLNTIDINNIKGLPSSNVSDFFTEKYNKVAISWVDDDFSSTSVPKIKTMCDEIGCKCDFAVIPSERSGSGEYPTDSEYYFSEEVLQRIKEYEELGFHVEMHPIHKGWYSSGSSTFQGKEYVQKLLIKTIRVFNDNGILTSNCIIYPGGSSDNSDVVNVCKSWLNYGITAGINNPNNGICNKFQLKRTFIQFDSTHTKTWYKQKVDEAVSSGSWLIFGTHSYQFDDSGTVDETTMSLANLKEIIQYANDKCSLKPISEIFRERKPMLELYSE